MHRWLRRRGGCFCGLTAAVALLAGCDPHAHWPESGGEPAETGAIVRDLSGPWGAHAGDDPRWAAPTLDDSAWERVHIPDFNRPGLPTGQRFWLRRVVRVDEDMRPRWRNVPLGVSVGQGFGVAYELYADGQRVGRHGRLPPDPHTGPIEARAFAIPSATLDDDEVVIALRVWRWSARGFAFGGDPFAVGPASVLRARVQVREMSVGRLITGGAIFCIVLVLAALFHLVAWRGRRELRAYGWYGGFLLAEAILALMLLRGRPVWPHLSWELGAVLPPLLRVALPGLLWELVLAFFELRRPRWWPAIWLIFIADAALSATGLARGHAWLGHVVPVLSWLAVIVVVAGPTRRGPSARTVVGLSFIALALASLLARAQSTGLVASWGLTGLNELVHQMSQLGLGPRTLGLFGLIGAMAFALADRFQTQLRDLDLAHRASARFVPRDFLRLLGRERVTDVSRGDAAQTTMTVMFADVRGFTTRSERQSPAESFAWLNRYLACVEPVIRAHDGFVNQYYGDGIMALFGRADDAARAALEMQRALSEAEDLGEDVRIGVGIHTGPLLLGTIGGAERLDTGVVGDAVNVAARIEGMTKEHGEPVLLSGSAVEALEHPDRFVVEQIATVTPRGKSAAITLFAARSYDAAPAAAPDEPPAT